MTRSARRVCAVRTAGCVVVGDIAAAARIAAAMLDAASRRDAVSLAAAAKEGAVLATARGWSAVRDSLAMTVNHAPAVAAAGLGTRGSPGTAAAAAHALWTAAARGEGAVQVLSVGEWLLAAAGPHGVMLLARVGPGQTVLAATLPRVTAAAAAAIAEVAGAAASAVIPPLALAIGGGLLVWSIYRSMRR